MYLQNHRAIILIDRTLCDFKFVTLYYYFLSTFVILLDHVIYHVQQSQKSPFAEKNTNYNHAANLNCHHRLQLLSRLKRCNYSSRYDQVRDLSVLHHILRDDNVILLTLLNLLCVKWILRTFF